MNIKSFPSLYQKTQTGAIQRWDISVESKDVLDNDNKKGVRTVGVIVTIWGQLEGKLQETRDVISNGKNPGKANATTAVEQAVKEAAAKWLKQKKKGYVETVEVAETGAVDATIIMGGIEPMLAPNKSYPKDGDLVKRITFPCHAQPKLDGMRCIAVIKDGKATLFSRTRKVIKTCPHIIEALEKKFTVGSYIFDGELYCHEYRNSFEDLISILRQDEPDKAGLHKIVEYHVYDCVEVSGLPDRGVMETTPFKARIAAVAELLGSAPGPLQVVQTARINSLEEFVVFYEKCVENEYEGAMARNSGAPYEAGKRSPHLQKAKPFQDEDFDITGVNEGRGKDAGTAATFTCVTSTGKEFRARLKAPYTYRRELLEKPELWRGKKLTVTLKRFTADGVPYLPVAKAIRNYE